MDPHTHQQQDLPYCPVQPPPSASSQPPLILPTLKEELRTWADAVHHFESANYDASLGAFELIAGSAKIHFNMGMVFLELGNLEEAIANFEEAVRCDSWLAVAFFQKGVCWYLAGRVEVAVEDFEEGFKKMRGNHVIDYTQLGLDYKLYECELLYNLGLCKYRLGDLPGALSSFTSGTRSKSLPEHETISSALEYLQYHRQPHAHYPYQGAEAIDEAFEESFRPFQVPRGKIYKPAKSKVDNSKKKDYLGSSKVVAAVNEADSYTGFSGAKITRRVAESHDDEPQEPRHYTSTTLARVGTVNARGQAMSHGGSSSGGSGSGQTSPYQSVSRGGVGLGTPGPGGGGGGEGGYPPSNLSITTTALSSAGGSSLTSQFAATSNSPPPLNLHMHQPGNTSITTTANSSTGSCSTQNSLARRPSAPSSLQHHHPPRGFATASPTLFQGSASPHHVLQQQHHHHLQQHQQGHHMGRSPATAPATDAGFAGYHQLNPPVSAHPIHPSIPASRQDTITIKCHYATNDIRKLALPLHTSTFSALCTHLRSKFALPPDQRLSIQYRDDDGDMIRMRDEEDWSLAVATGKVEIWVENE